MTTVEPLDRVQDRSALRRLVETYARGADLRDAEMYADVFTDDALLVTQVGEVRGRERLLTIAPRLGRYRVTMHIVANHYVEFDATDPTHATGAAYCVARHVQEVEGIDRVYVMHIRYDDTYVKNGDDWRIAERRLDVLWTEDHPLNQ
jgi:uncharacterized protein (TIGR02246 family)